MEAGRVTGGGWAWVKGQTLHLKGIVRMGVKAWRGQLLLRIYTGLRLNSQHPINQYTK